MIWLTWRQARTQLLIAAGALAVLAGYLVYLGFAVRHDYTTDVLNCLPSECSVTRHQFGDRYQAPVKLLGALLIAVPGLVGTFWGAPLVAREFESRTDRLVWNQSVTRGRWLAVKLGLLGLAALAVTGLLSLLLTWSFSRYDQYSGDRFAAMNFAARNVVPLGYAAFTFVLGVVVGLLVRRSVPAMAIVVGVFAAVQIVVPLAVRSHLMTPSTTTVQLTADVMEHANGFGISPKGAHIEGYTLAGAWPMSDVSDVVHPDGSPYTAEEARTCMTGTPEKDFECMGELHLQFAYTYQPGSRYWPFQWIELSLYSGLAVLLTAFAFWWVRRRVA